MKPLNDHKTSAMVGMVAATIVWVLYAHIAWAGAICGTVRDRQTAAPVARAGIFVRTTGGDYTGFHAATDSVGTYCVESVPAGTYDLEVRVDHYEVMYVRNVQVSEDVTSVDVGSGATRFYLAPPRPNPAKQTVFFHLELAAPVAAELAVYDIAGRLIRTWNDPEADPGERTIEWDFRNAYGRPVPPGIYFIRLHAGKVNLNRSLVRLD